MKFDLKVVLKAFHLKFRAYFVLDNYYQIIFGIGAHNYVSTL